MALVTRDSAPDKGDAPPSLAIPSSYNHLMRACPAFLLLILPALLLAGCLPAPRPAAPAEELPSATATFTHTPEPQPSLTPEPSNTPTAAPSRTPTVTATLTPSASWAVLRGEVLQRANCRYGAGAVYLYKYGLVPGSNLEIIGRNDAGTWLQVRAIGGDNPCWVKADLMAPTGDVMSVAPVRAEDYHLPRSPYYGPPAVTGVERDGDQVTVTFSGIALRAGDDSLQTPYVVEACCVATGSSSSRRWERT